ncbi:MAG: hypothetical protein Q7U53_07275 [Anaerolineaceae bacterium]|nr:hypothetical protein [Anaerolineaceae bacterium]
MEEENSYAKMENDLNSNLLPVYPNPEFIKNLRKRLLGSKNIQIENPNHGIAFILIGLGLFIGALSVWLFRRIDTA